MTSPAIGASAPTVFNFQSIDVRAFADDAGEPWFCAADVCAVLGYRNPRTAIANHCRDKGVLKRDTPTDSGSQEMTFINEGNLYRLIVKSRKPEAQTFEQEVMEVILPAIRKTGRYESAALPSPANALPPPDRITPNLRRRINRKAHALALDQYDTLQDLLEDLVTSNLRCNASESDCEDYIERFGSNMGGVTLVNTYDLYQLARQTTGLLDKAGEALAVVHRLETHTGLQLYQRIDVAGLPDSLCKTVFEAVRKHESESKRSAA